MRQTQARRQQFEDQVRRGVRRHLCRHETGCAAYEAAIQSRILQQQSVKVEQETFDVGLAANYMVIQYQIYLVVSIDRSCRERGGREGNDCP